MIYENSTHHVFIEAIPPVDIALLLFAGIGYLLSVSWSSVVLWKFYINRSKYDVQTKNLASFCSSLLLTYFIVVFRGSPYGYSKAYQILDAYMFLASSFLLSVLAWHTCLCIRNVQDQLTHLFGSNVFYACSIAGWITPVLIIFSHYIREPSLKSVQIINSDVRMLNILPLVILAWHMKSIGWGRVVNDNAFFTHIRVFVIVAGFCFISPTLFEPLILINEQFEVYKISFDMSDALYMWQGFLFGLCFLSSENDIIDVQNSFHFVRVNIVNKVWGNRVSSYHVQSSV